MANFKSKSLCDKSLKIKNLIWQFSCIFRWLRRAILRFFCRRCYHGDIFRPKLSLLKISKKDEKWVFLYGKIRPLVLIFFAFFPIHHLGLSESYVLHPRTLIKTQKDDFHQWSPIVHKWSFLIILSKKSPFSPIKIWSKRSLKIAPKRRLLRKKLIKSTLKHM